MIVLNESKELRRIEMWSQIAERPGFTNNIDPKAHTLKAIIGSYIFPERIPCGLSNCHTPHAKGYLVETASGLETNIGHDCGRTYFGVDFETLSRKFDRDITEKENREKLWSFAFKIDELKRRIQELRNAPHGGNWVYKRARQLLDVSAAVPQGVVRNVTAMVKSRNPSLVLEREASEREIQELEVAQGRTIHRPHIVQDHIADVQGLDALYPENDLRQLLVIGLEERVKKFEMEEIDSLSYEPLRSWANWIGTVESTLAQATRSIESGQLLLRGENLRPFDRVLTDHDDRAIFSAFLKDLTSSGK